MLRKSDAAKLRVTVRQDERNVIRAFVHSTQTVMVGATLKMQLAENCLTDDGQRIRKGHRCSGR